MGVHGLWELLAPVGRRVSVETLAGKRLAVDASIWMVQFMRAMRDDKGDMIRDAHLLGFLRRICKLLFLRARPVFVFDGATPALKRRTLAARRRHRDAAQAKVRKTAEKLLLSHLKARKLEELAAQIKQDRAKNDAKVKQAGSSRVPRGEKVEGINGDQNRNDDDNRLEELSAQIKQDRAKHTTKGKQVGSSRRDETVEINADQNQNNDSKNGGETVAPIDQEKLDEMLAASLAAEDESDFSDKGKHHCARDSLQEGAHLNEDDDDDDDNDDDGEMIFPMTTGDIDPAVLASLPPSMQLDLLVQMRERVMAENRQEYQKIKKEPAKFSELQIQSYLKTVAFRREIDEVQRCAAGRGVGGVQTSKIASEANREFIFSSSFTGDKQTLAQRGGKEQVADSVHSKALSSAASKSNYYPSSKTLKPHTRESLRDFGPDVETYRDERGRIRVSRVRAMGIRMTRDIQRNLDFIREHEQVNSRQQTNVGKGSTSSNEPPDFPEHLFESNGLRTSLGLIEDFAENVNHNSSSLAGGSNNISDSPCHGSKETIEISFVDDQTELKDTDDQIFLHLVSGSSSNLFANDDCSTEKPAKSDDSECLWEEGVIEKLPVEIDHKDHQSSLPDNNCMDDEVEWEEGGCDVLAVPSSSENNQCKLPKGDLEEEAILQEAIRRSLEDFKKQESETVIHKDLQASIAGKSLQSNDVVLKPSGSLRKAHSHHEAALVEESAEEMGTKKNYVGTDVMHDLGVLEADRQEDESRTELENNDGHADTKKAYSLDFLPPCNISTSTPATKPSNSSKDQDSDVMVYATATSERAKDDSGNIIKENRTGSYHSKCNNDDTYIIESSKSPGKDMVMDELIVDTAIHRENLTQRDMDFSTSEIIYTKMNDSIDGRSMSAANVEKEISLLRQEQIDLGNERRKLESHAESVSSEMFAECQELLQIFGLPYIIAPMEAEAQCAYMEMNNLVDGVVTDDSDVFLFGARNVYKNIFDDRKYVETYFMKDIESELGLAREQLIRMAMLLGSDYTEGISGIGIVNAIEVIHAFPEEDGLKKFREWIESPDPTILGKLDMETGSNSKKKEPDGNSSDGKGNNHEPEAVESSNETQRIKKIFMSKHRNVSKNWHIPSTFPSELVRTAYIDPQVDDSAEPFSWGRPDSGILRKLCWERFGWSKEKADELLIPVLREYNKHETQLRMEAFYSFNDRFAKIRSKRIKKAIKGITGKSFEETDGLDQHNPSTNATKKKGTSSSSSTRARGKRNNNDVPTNTRSQEDKKMGASDNFADMEEPNDSKEKIASPSGRSRGRNHSRGRGRRRMSVGHQTTASQEDSGVKLSLALDEDSHEKHTNNFKQPGLTLRRSSRKRKQVTYEEDDHEADGTDVPMHQIDENNTSQASEGNIAEQETRFNLVQQDMTEQNSDQMHTDPGTAGDMDEDPLGFKVHEDHPTDSAPKDYLFTGGGFCVDEGDEQDISGDRSGAEIEDGTSGVCEDISGVSVNGTLMSSSTTGECTENASREDRGASSSPQRRNARRGLSAIPTLTKRRRKS